MTARAQTSQPELRLRWWAVALPVAVFLGLLALLASGGENTTAGGMDPLTRVVEHLQSTLL
ncbi:hypothetical protein FH609_029870 [Streptomyces sp. 3MP-14]|uniref:Uncharacterized protein n=1 Tax=Streptomyces mimosae TaxID=2586635 RepID=A0A5N5ZRC8_9ACTN|nr:MULTISPECIES: hypothetical protein [Streptomyces]KAB8157478.1 hypothetical protein FH607_030100 [Streptomyces mimosae]KAB8172467.1 hypothetical protein FH609_029870 [Streptomyces sp. 3MP-14]